MVFAILLTAVLSYLLGNLNGAILLSRLVEKDDVRNHGSGNAGFTNFFRNYGKSTSLLVILIDGLKTALSCLLGGWLLGKYGLYPGQPQVLFALSKLGAPTQNELAAHLGIGKASAGVSIRRLETGGFVKRIRDKKDTRCIRLSLTKKGEDYARWCSIDYDMFFTTMLESFSAEERGEALACIKAMEGSLDALRSRLES